MTIRLYYDEPYRATFDATVTSCVTRNGAIEVMLDQTAFYPTSGGQPHDLGMLSSARVLDVVDSEAEEIVHVVDARLAEGTSVRGAIDWERRFDHMQQHTGQHVLSAAFDRMFGVRTESFHLGVTAATIDLAREVSVEEVRRAEDEANRIVWEDRPVAIRVATPEEAANLPLRKASLRSGPIRLIEVCDFDLSACGGTHVSRTGAIGIVATTGTDKFRGGSRIEFVCGGRVLARLREWRATIGDATRYLSVSPAELSIGIERLQSDSKQYQRTIRVLHEQLAAHEGRLLIQRARRLPDRLVVAEALDGWDAAGLKALAAAAVAEEPLGLVILFSRATPALVVVARGAKGGVDASAVLKALTTKFGGRGGGRPELAQGGGLDADTDTLLTEANRLLTQS
jgi:alanyl-tRNA synthetase